MEHDLHKPRIHLNTATLQVTIDRPLLQQSETVSYKEWLARGFVVAHLANSGRFSRLVTPGAWNAVIRLADGLRPWSAELEKYFEGGFDWSHIRDSSWEAFVAMAEFLAETLWNKPFDCIMAEKLVAAARFADKDLLTLADYNDSLKEGNYVRY